ncbi:MAG: polyhydroxyalkanoate synthesis repressor PhaR [Alphaproteobacteria bacterium]|nr:polyhydroxyalkanoate synthesis repressor PhaR [Alphaproteobacteria bacterium]
MTEKSAEPQPVTIKKYANRRLYNTATSSYVTLDDLCRMVKDGQDFVVFDAKSGEDITRSVLTQIIFEEEGKGQNMLPIRFLRQLIRFYGDSLQAFVPNYLDVAIESFVRNQEQLRRNAADAFGPFNPFSNIEEMSRQNMAMFQRAMSMFTPFPGQGQGTEGAAPKGETPAAASEDDKIKALKTQLDSVQRQLDALGKAKTG